MERLRPRTRLLAPAVALATVGALFVVKYGVRVAPSAEVLAAAYAVVFVLAPFAADRWLRPSAQVVRRVWIVFVLVALALALLSPEANRVARLPALTVWLERLYDGHFPYGSPIRPSGFPGLYALALPFWAADGLRLLPVVGVAVFSWAALRAGAWQAAALIWLMPSVWYELAVHSELFFNVALALGSLWLFERARERGGGMLIVAAALAGFLLSTRLVVGVVYAVWGAYAFRSAWAQGAAFAAVALTTWAATWVPFMLWDPAQFAALGPFSIQGLYLPRSAILAGVGLALALGWYARSLESVVARVGWLLFALVSLSMGVTVAELGFEAALHDGFDLAYFVLPTPFLLLTLGQRGRIVSASSALKT